MHSVRQRETEKCERAGWRETVRLREDDCRLNCCRRRVFTRQRTLGGLKNDVESLPSDFGSSPVLGTAAGGSAPPQLHSASLGV